MKKKHEHKMVLVRQVSLPFFTELNIYKCRCGHKRKTMSHPGMPEPVDEKKFYAMHKINWLYKIKLFEIRAAFFVDKFTDLDYYTVLVVI